MRYTYMYPLKCGAIERNEVDLGWIYIDIWMVTNREDDKKKRKRGKKKKLWEFVWGGKNVKVGIYLSIA